MRIIAHILRALFVGALFVLLSLPNQSLASSDSTQKSLDYIYNHQGNSGGIFEEGSTEPDDGVTAWAAVAFASAGYDPNSVKQNGGQSIVDYISSRACTYETATDIERTILALAAADFDPSNITNCDLVSKLNEYKDPSGKIGPDIISTIFSVLAYSSIDTLVNQATIDYIANQQQTDGGWDSGWGTDSNTTSQAIMALAAVNYDKSSSTIISAKQYLKSLQTSSGGIKYDNNTWTSDSDSFSDAYTLQAIYSLSELPNSEAWTIGDKSILDDASRYKKSDFSYLFSLDPSWGDSTPVWTTAVVIPALESKPLGWRGVDLVPFVATTTPRAEENDDETPAAAPTGSPQVEQNDTSQSSSVSAIGNHNSNSSMPAKTHVDNTNNSSNDSVLGNVEKEIDNPKVLGVTDTSQTQSNNTNVILLLLTGTGLILGIGISILLSKFKLILPIVIIATIISIPAASFASRAGVVVRYGDGSVQNKCVEFDETSISGFTLLQRGDFSPILDRGFLVSIGGERAKTFDDPGSQSDYWSYWQLRDGSWSYSRASATSSRISDGDIDGWQRGTSDLALPLVNYIDICPPIETAPITESLPPDTPVERNDTSVSTISDTSENSRDIASNNNDSTVAQDPIDQITEEGDVEIASVKGASTASSDNHNYQLKIVVYAIPILAASAVIGFIAHRYLIIRRCHSERR